MIGCDHTARTRTVVDDDRLAECLRHARSDGARDDVGRAAREKADDDADRAVRILRGRIDRRERNAAA